LLVAWGLVAWWPLFGCDLPQQRDPKGKSKAVRKRATKAAPRKIGALKTYRYRIPGDKLWQTGKARVGQPINPGGGRWQHYIYKGEAEIVSEIGPPFRINGKVVGLKLSSKAPLSQNLALINKHRKHLEIIDYEFASKLPDRLLKAIADLPARDLSLDLTSFSGSPRELSKLSRLGGRLAHLSLYSAEVENDDGILRLGRHLGFLRRCTRLWHLNLGGTNLTNRGLRSVQKLVWLRSLMLSDTKVNDKGMGLLTPLSNLEILWVPERVSERARKQLKTTLKNTGIY